MASARRLGVLAAAALLAAAVGGGCGDPAAREQQHLSRGEAYLEEGKIAEAVLELQNALRLVPNDARAHHALAQALLAANQSQKALWELQEVVRLDPGNLDARLQYGRTLLLGGRPELEEAVKQADAVLAVDPSRVPALLLKGRALQQLERPQEALEPFEQAVQDAPEDASALLLLANVYVLQGDRVRAEALFRKLVEVSPIYSSYETLAGFLAVLGRNEEAEQAYRTAIERAEGKDQPKAHIDLSDFLVRRGRGADAERVLEQGIETLDDDLDLVYRLARMYQRRGATAEADGVIQRAAAERPSDPMPLAILSRYRAALGDFDGALEASDRALAAAPDDIQTQLQKAELLVDIGVRGDNKERILEGRRMVEAVIETKENVPAAALYVRGKVELAEGNKEAAAKTLREVVDLQPDWALPHYVLGAALFANGDPQGARTVLLRAVELDPTNADARKLLAQVHTGLGDLDLAIEVARGSSAIGEDPSLHFLIAQNLIRQRKFDEAAKELGAIPESQRGAEDWYALGRVAIFRKDDAAARKNLLRAQEKDPSRFEVLQALLALDAKERRLAESKERIQAAASARPRDTRLVRLLGQVSLAERDFPAAEASFKRAIEIVHDAGVYDACRPGRDGRLAGPDPRGRPRAEPRHRLAAPGPWIAVLPAGSQEGCAGALRGRDPVGSEARAREEQPGLPARRERREPRPRARSRPRGEDPASRDPVRHASYVPRARPRDAAPATSSRRLWGMDPDDPLLPTVRHHLALAYEATGDVKTAREQVERALADLEAKHEGGPEAARGPDPSAELRALLGRLRASEG
jgi:tetratricopeptide (TPR) repeat protein